MDAISAARRRVSIWSGREPSYTASILMTAYKAETTLREAIESIYAQKVRPGTTAQLVVGVDPSPDDTLALARELAGSAPGWLTVEVMECDLPKITLNGRMTGRANFFNCYSRLRGAVILYLNCDDSWMTDTKLQSQIDHVQDTGRACCTTLRTDATPLEDANAVSEMLNPFQHGTTVLFSSFAMPYVPLGRRRFWWEIGFLDLPIICFVYERFGIDRLMTEKTFYRVNAGGFWSSQDPHRQYRIISDAAWKMAAWGPYGLKNRLRILSWARAQKPLDPPG